MLSQIQALEHAARISFGGHRDMEMPSPTRNALRGPMSIGIAALATVLAGASIAMIVF